MFSADLFAVSKFQVFFSVTNMSFKFTAVSKKVLLEFYCLILSPLKETKYGC